MTSPLPARLAPAARPARRPGARAAAGRRLPIVTNYPHDPTAFTQGLLYLDGKLYESTGPGRPVDDPRVRIEDGRVLRRSRCRREHFGEGLVNWGAQI